MPQENSDNGKGKGTLAQGMSENTSSYSSSIKQITQAIAEDSSFSNILADIEKISTLKLPLKKLEEVEKNTLENRCHYLLCAIIKRNDWSVEEKSTLIALLVNSEGWTKNPKDVQGKSVLDKITEGFIDDVQVTNASELEEMLKKKGAESSFSKPVVVADSNSSASNPASGWPDEITDELLGFTQPPLSLFHKITALLNFKKTLLFIAAFLGALVLFAGAVTIVAAAIFGATVVTALTSLPVLAVFLAAGAASLVGALGLVTAAYMWRKDTSRIPTLTIALGGVLSAIIGIAAPIGIVALPALGALLGLATPLILPVAAGILLVGALTTFGLEWALYKRHSAENKVGAADPNNNSKYVKRVTELGKKDEDKEKKEQQPASALSPDSQKTDAPPAASSQADPARTKETTSSDSFIKGLLSSCSSCLFRKSRSSSKGEPPRAEPRPAPEDLDSTPSPRGKSSGEQS